MLRSPRPIYNTPLFACGAQRSPTPNGRGRPPVSARTKGRCAQNLSKIWFKIYQIIYPQMTQIPWTSKKIEMGDRIKTLIVINWPLIILKDNKNNLFNEHSDETNEIVPWRAIPHAESYVWQRSALINSFIMTTFVRRRSMVRNTISSKFRFRSYHPQKKNFWTIYGNFCSINNCPIKNLRNLWNLWRKNN